MNSLLLALCCFGADEHQLESLLGKVPPQANTIIIVDVESLHRSELGSLQKWSEQHQSNYIDGTTNFPPDSKYVVLASEISHRNLNNAWEVGIVQLKNELDWAEIAKNLQGQADEIAGLDTILTARDTYLVKFDSKLAGFHYPAVRQPVSRWLRTVGADRPSYLSEYLQNAASIAKDGQIVIAMDLQDTLDAEAVEIRLESMESAPKDREEFARTVASLRGVTFAIRVTDKIIGKAQVDFNAPLLRFTNSIKPVFFEVLKSQGVFVEDFADWRLEVKGNSASFHGELSEAGLRKILSIVEMPPATLTATQQVSQHESEGDKKAKASQNYFHAVTKLLDELRKHQGSTFGQTAVWHDRYSRKIDRLPILNVDPKLLDYGAQTAELLRNISLSMRGIGIKSGARQAQYYGSSSGTYYYNGPAYHYQSDKAANRNRVRREEIAKGVTDRYEQWKVIDDATAAIRKEMVDQYQVDF